MAAGKTNGGRPPQERNGRQPGGHELDAEVDEVMRHIESRTGSMYAIHAGGDAEEFDPGNLHPDEIEDADDVEGSLAHGMAIDELAGDTEDFEAVALDSEETGHGKSKRKGKRGNAADDGGSGRHTGLKVALAIVIVLLLAIVCGVGYLVVRGGSAAVTVARPDAETLVADSSQGSSVKLAEVDPAEVPALASVFGLRLADAERELGSRLQMQDAPEKASDKRVRSLERMAEGSYLDARGNEIASVGLGLDARDRVVYAYLIYNLDDIGIPEASFADLVASDGIGSTILRDMGAGEVELGTPELGSDDEDEDQARYKGKVAAEAPGGEDGSEGPGTWELAETYAYATSSSTITRTLVAELY